MALQTPVLIKTFTGDTALSYGAAVVASNANAGNVMLPGGANATKFVGFVQAASDANFVTPIMLQGIAQGITDGSAGITAGDYLVIADNSGRVKSVSPADGTNIRQVVGIALETVAATAGLYVNILIQPMLYSGA